MQTERTDEDGTGVRTGGTGDAGDPAGRAGDDRNEHVDRDRNEHVDRDRRTRDRTERDRAPARAEQVGDEEVGRDEVIETTTPRIDLGSVLATAAGVALTLVGIVALVRTGVDRSWYDPVEQIAGVDHTAMLGAIELGVGVLLILAGLTGSRMMAALVALVAGIAAAVVAIEPSLVADDLALERGWAAALAVGGLALALVLILTRERRQERRVERRTFRHA